jgi:hypothetical protein
MSSEVLERRFAAIGARLRAPQDGWRGAPRIDIGTDRRGEYFDVRFTGSGDAVNLEVIDVDKGQRHLLLLAREGVQKSKFLCGHDERHWFVAAIPEAAPGVTGVATAKAALQPDLVRAAVGRTRPKDPFRRRNRAYLRQGEWFFVPAPALRVPDAFALRDEPLMRGRGSKPHMMELAYRRGGRIVYVDRLHPDGISETAFARLPERERRRGTWQRMVAEPEVYAKGAIRHPDHATLLLPDWHRVAMNTEQSARAMQHVVFLD